MGDAGALFLGFLLAYLGLKLRFDTPADVTFLVPIVVMGVPIFDTTLVTVTRIAAVSARSKVGATTRATAWSGSAFRCPPRVALIYAVGVCLGLVALVISRVDRVSAYLLATAVGIMGLLSGALLVLIPYEDPPAESAPNRG